MRADPRAEHRRIGEEKAHESDNGLWRKWGPYLSERQWGTVREDYSADGSAWEYFSHDDARSRAYRWGEDGIAGVSDHHQRLCLSLALWNGRDPILKERLFGLTNGEGNHGEDCKELYYYLDATPTHSYLKMLYKYPQREFPYGDLVTTNASRSRLEPEYELLATGVFDDDRYFDVFVEYGRSDPTTVNMRITIHNRGPEDARIHVLPQLWFRNTWSWKHGSPKPQISASGARSVRASHHKLEDSEFFVEAADAWLFTENETNLRRHSGSKAVGFSKDAFHEFLIHGKRAALHPDQKGTKAAAWVVREVPAGGSVTLRAALTRTGANDPFASFDTEMDNRKAEADAYYAELQKELTDEDARHVQRQALAGLIWSKQYYSYDVPRWLDGDPALPTPSAARKRGRNSEWKHLNNDDIISMPDKWEYPWYAAWDLAFHAVAFALVDPGFAKSQLLLMTREWYMHPNGQLPAYEWALGDVILPFTLGPRGASFRWIASSAGMKGISFFWRRFSIS